MFRVDKQMETCLIDLLFLFTEHIEIHNARLYRMPGFKWHLRALPVSTCHIATWPFLKFDMRYGG